MQKEAITARELLNIADVNLEEKMHISELIRTSLLKLFDIILDYFPPESSVKYYPINRDYPALTSELTGYDLNNSIVLCFLLHLFDGSEL
jgi:hypothetical protein